MLTEEIVKLGVEYRIGSLAGIGDIAEIVEEAVEIGALAIEILCKGLTLGGVVELTSAGLGGLRDLLFDLLLLIGEVAGLLAGGAHLFGELARRLVL